MKFSKILTKKADISKDFAKDQICLTFRNYI